MSSETTKPANAKTLTIADLNNQSVKELRKYVRVNKIFSGISNLTKKQIIADIIDSQFWKDLQNKKLPEKIIKTEKQIESNIKTDVQDIEKLKQKLKTKLRTCERRLIKRSAEIERLNKLIKKETPVFREDNVDIDKEAIEKAFKKIALTAEKAEEVIKDDIEEIKEEQKEELIVEEKEITTKPKKQNTDFKILKTILGDFHKTGHSIFSDEFQKHLKGN